MEDGKEVWPLWIDWDDRIISFHEVEGMVRLEYQTHKEILAFAVEKGFEGFGIQ